jgi:hypothetical protein
MWAVAGLPALMGMMLLSLYLSGLSRQRRIHQDGETERPDSNFGPILNGLPSSV